MKRALEALTTLSSQSLGNLRVVAHYGEQQACGDAYSRPAPAQGEATVIQDMLRAAREHENKCILACCRGIRHWFARSLVNAV